MLLADGKYPVYHGGLQPLGYYNISNRQPNTVMVINVGASAGIVGYSDIEFWSSDGCYCLEHTSVALNKYLYYVMQSNERLIQSRVRYAGIPTLDAKVVENIEIPIPPFEVQERIVSILDKFEMLTNSLVDGLPAEMEARKKQYEYYRDLLLDFKSDGGGYALLENIVQWLPLDDIIKSLKTGLNPRTNFKLNNVGCTQPYITGKDIVGNQIVITDRTDKITPSAVALINKRANLEQNDVLFASTGTGTVGRMALVKEYDNSWSISESIYSIKANQNKILPKYLMYALYADQATKQFIPKISKASVPHLKVSDLLKVEIAIPPLCVQQWIIEILDKFDNLTSDLISGLPAEIEARKKQYEYYREKLLSFKEKTA